VVDGAFDVFVEIEVLTYSIVSRCTRRGRVCERIWRRALVGRKREEA
jgi:hypothetical protein